LRACVLGTRAEGVNAGTAYGSGKSWLTDVKVRAVGVGMDAGPAFGVSDDPGGWLRDPLNT